MKLSLSLLGFIHTVQFIQWLLYRDNDRHILPLHLQSDQHVSMNKTNYGCAYSVPPAEGAVASWTTKRLIIMSHKRPKPQR